MKKNLRVKIDAHAKRWEQLQNIPGHTTKMKEKKERILRSAANKRDTFVEEVPCPACDNNAILTAEIAFDSDAGHV